MTVSIWTDGKRILSEIPYDRGRGPTRAKQVPGARPKWDKTVTPNKFLMWTYPLTVETCLTFRQVFGDDLRIDNGLADWYRQERESRHKLEEMRSGDVPDMPRVRELNPTLWEALNNRPFQISGAAFVVEGRTVCLGDEPRLGKTYQCLAAMIQDDAKRVLVACPKSATNSVWQKKISELAPGYVPFVARGDRAQREKIIRGFEASPEEHKVLVIVKEMIRIKRMYRCAEPPVKPSTYVKLADSGYYESKIRPGKKGGCPANHNHKTVLYPEWPDLFDRPWDMIILDECHHALASTKNIQSDGISQIRLGAMRLPFRDDGIKLAMSGTPFRSKAEKSWGVLNWLDPSFFGSFWRFAEEYFPVSSNGYGKIIGGKPLNPEKFQNAMRRYYLARTKTEVAPDLKPLEYVEIELPMDDKQLSAYQEMVEMASADIENGKLNANGLLAEITRAKQFACSYGRFGNDGKFYPTTPSNKLEWLLDFLAERDETEGKVVVASQFTKLINMITDELRRSGYPVVVITGDTTGLQRDRAQEEFQNGETRIALINVAAGGEAIDLSAADEFVLLDEPWEDWLIQQSENRIQNLAKTQQLTVFKVRSEGTLEAEIAQLTEEQRRILMSTRPEALELAKDILR